MTQFHRFSIVVAAACLIAASGCASLSAPGQASLPWKSSKPSVARTRNQDKFESQLSLARLSERHGQYEHAAALYEAVLRKDSQNRMAYHRLGVIAARGGKYQEAESRFSRAAELGADDAEFWSDRGYCAYLQDDLDLAEQCFHTALKRDPRHKAARNNLGLVLGERGQFEDSLAQFKQAVGEAEAHANLAYARSQAGDFSGAEQDYHRALRLNGNLRAAAEALVQLPQNRHIAENGSVASSASLAGLRVKTSKAERDLATESHINHAEFAAAPKDASNEAPAELAASSEALAVAPDTLTVIPSAPAKPQPKIPANALRISDDESESEVTTVSFNASALTPAEIAQEAYLKGASPVAGAGNALTAGATQAAATGNTLRPATPQAAAPPWQRPTWMPPGP